MSKIIFANIINELMISTPTRLYARGMNAVTPRKLWLAEENDAVITPNPIPNYFQDYVYSITNVNAESVFLCSPAGDDVTFLVDRLMRSEHYGKFQHYIETHPDTRLQVFAADKPTISFAKKHNLNLMYYHQPLSDETVNTLYSLNTKSGFRQFASELGMRIAPGFSCNGKDALFQQLLPFAKKHNKIIIKFNRSSNGYGHLVTSANELLQENGFVIVEKHLEAFAEQPFVFTVEKYIESSAMPSVEVEVFEDSIQVSYICDQRCRNHAYSGMETPPQNLSAAVLDELTTIGTIFANKVHALNFRGYCDVDACLSMDGKLYVTETNFRRTAGTFIDALLKRFMKGPYLQQKVWLQDARVGRSDIDFITATKLLAKNHIAFSPRDITGAILYVDTLATDGKWRYIIFANNMLEANEIEKEIVGCLQMVNLT